MFGILLCTACTTVTTADVQIVTCSETGYEGIWSSLDIPSLHVLEGEHIAAHHEAADRQYYRAIGGRGYYDNRPSARLPRQLPGLRYSGR